MSKHQEYCCGCRYDNPCNSCYLQKCCNCELGLREETNEWEPSDYEVDNFLLKPKMKTILDI